jgi:predicted phosphodiesterase
MKIEFHSDLHLESRPGGHMLMQTTSDLIVLAGDIDTGLRGLKYADVISDMHEKPVIYIAGNHEFYRHDYAVLLEEMRGFAAQLPDVHFLEQDELIIQGTRFLGTTLWTDFKGNGSTDRAQNMNELRQNLADFHLIKCQEKSFTPDDALAIHEESREWLTAKFREPFKGRTVVVTHHAPSLLCEHPSFNYGPMTTGFVSEMDNLVSKADLWICGHTHANIDLKIGKTRLVSNQMGYRHEPLPVPYQRKWVINLENISSHQDKGLINHG